MQKWKSFSTFPTWKQRPTKDLPSLPSRDQFSALAINGQWTISGVPLANLQQPLSSRGMLRTPFLQLYHLDLRHGAIYVKTLPVQRWKEQQ